MPNLDTHRDTLDLLIQQCDTMRDITSISVNSLIAISDGSYSKENMLRIAISALEEIRLKLVANNYDG